MEIYVSTDVEADGPMSTKKNLPREWFGATPHTHVALDDAIGQGALFGNLLAERNRRLGRR